MSYIIIFFNLQIYCIRNGVKKSYRLRTIKQVVFVFQTMDKKGGVGQKLESVLVLPHQDFQEDKGTLTFLYIKCLVQFISFSHIATLDPKAQRTCFIEIALSSSLFCRWKIEAERIQAPYQAKTPTTAGCFEMRLFNSFLTSTLKQEYFYIHVFNIWELKSAPGTLY